MQSTPETTPRLDKFAYLKALRGHPLLNGKSGTQLIIRIMVDYADAKTLGSARPAVSTLAADAGMGRTAAKAALHSAIELGFLRVEKEATNRAPAVYSLHMPLGGQIPTVQRVGSRPSRGSDSDPNQINYQTNYQIPPGEAANDAPPSRVAETALTGAPTQSEGPPQGHGEEPSDKPQQPAGGTPDPWATAPEVEVLTSKDGSKELGRGRTVEVLVDRWGDVATERIITLAMGCAGHLMSSDLEDALAGVDEGFHDWCSDYGPRIASRAAISRAECVGVLTSKLRTYLLSDLAAVA